MKTLVLRKGEDRRLAAGHLWIFANEVDVAKTPLRAFEPGEQARVESASGRPFGLAYVNPASLICGRLVDTDATRRLDGGFFVHRLREALELRQRLYPTPFYRLVFSEGDWLPGLVVDRFDDVCVVQTTTAGMDSRRDLILEALHHTVRPRAVLFKNDARVRAFEGLPLVVEPAQGEGLGEVPEEMELEENGRRFVAPLAAGQKTGWFFDQRDNRRRFARHVAGRTVLDAFSYVGGVGITAAAADATRVTCLDASETALRHVRGNASLNGVVDRVETLHSDALTGLEMFAEEQRRFDCVCLDPPAFIKSRKDYKTGQAAYLKLNRLALRVMEPGGILMTCSCSQHFSPMDLRQTVQHAATQAKVRLQLLEQGTQAPDHPIHPAMPETEYLTALIFRVLR